MNSDCTKATVTNKGSEIESLSERSPLRCRDKNNLTTQISEQNRGILEEKFTNQERNHKVQAESFTDPSFIKVSSTYVTSMPSISKLRQLRESFLQNNTENKTKHPISSEADKENLLSSPSQGNLITSDRIHSQKSALASNHSALKHILGSKSNSKELQQAHGRADSKNNFTKDSFVNDSNKDKNIEVLPISINKNKQPIIVMKIDLGGDRKDELSIFEGDDPAQVALEFCQRNQLDNKVVEPLTRNVNLQIANYQKYKEERTRQLSQSKGQSTITTATPHSDNSVPRNRPQYEREDSQQSLLVTSGRRSKEDRTTNCSDPKASSERIRPVIKFELQSGKVIDDESPQPEKELRKDQFVDTERRITETKSTATFVQKEIPKLETTPATRKNLRESLDSQFRTKPTTSSFNQETVYEKRPNIRSPFVSPCSNKKTNKSFEKITSILTKSLTETKKRNELCISLVENNKHEVGLGCNIEIQNKHNQIDQKFFSPTSKETSFARLYQDANEKRKRLAQLSSKIKLERTLREEKENTFRPDINKSKDNKRDKTTELMIQSPINKSSSQIILTEFNFASPNNTSKGALNVRAFNSGTKSNPRSSSRAIQHTISVNLKQFQSSFVESPITKLTPKNSQSRFKEFASATQSFAFGEASSGKKVLNQSSHHIKDIRTETSSHKKGKSSMNAQRSTNNFASTGKKVSLRESILNRTRSERKLEKQQLQVQEERIVRQVFSVLDGSKSGVITAETVDITTINSKVLELISDILFSLEDEECSMDIQQFRQRLIEQNLVDRLMKLVP